MIKELNYYLTTNRFSDIVEEFNTLIQNYSNSFGNNKTGDVELREKTRAFCEEQLIKSGIRNQDNSFINVDAEFFDNGQLVEANCNRFIKDIVKAHSYQKILWEYMGTTGLMTNISKDKMKNDGFNYENYLPVSLKEKEIKNNKNTITRNFTKLIDNSGFAWNRGYNPNDRVKKNGWIGAFNEEGVWTYYKTDENKNIINDKQEIPTIRIVKTERGCMLYDAGNLLFDPVLLFYLTQNDEVYGGKQTNTVRLIEEIKNQMEKLNVKSITEVYTSDKKITPDEFKKVLGKIADENLVTIDSSSANQILKQTKENEKSELLKKESSQLQNKINVLIKAKPGISSQEITAALESNAVQVPVVSSKKEDAAVLNLSEEEFQSVNDFARNLSGKEKKSFYDSCAVLSANWASYKSCGISKSECIERLYNFIKENQDYDFSYEISLKEIINNAAEAVKFTSTGASANTSVLEECVKTFMPSQNQDDAVSYIKSVPDQKPEVSSKVYSALYNAIKNYQTIRMSTGMSIKELFDYAIKQAHGTLPKASFVPPVSGYITPNAKPSAENDVTGSKRIYFENKISSLFEFLKTQPLPQKKVTLAQLEKEFEKAVKDKPVVQLKINSARDFEMVYPVVDEGFTKLHGASYFEFLKEYLDSIEQNAEKSVGEGIEIAGKSVQIKPVFSQVDFVEKSEVIKLNGSKVTTAKGNGSSIKTSAVTGKEKINASENAIESGNITETAADRASEKIAANSNGMYEGKIILPENMHIMKSKSNAAGGIEKTHIMRMRKNTPENAGESQNSSINIVTPEVTLLLNNLSKAERVELMEYVNNDNALLSPLLINEYLSRKRNKLSLRSLLSDVAAMERHQNVIGMSSPLMTNGGYNFSKFPEAHIAEKSAVEIPSASISVKPAKKEVLFDQAQPIQPPVLPKAKSKSLSAEEQRLARLNANYEKDRAALAKTDPAFMAKNQFWDVGHAEGSGDLLTRDVEKLAEKQSDEYLKDVKGMNV